MELKNFDNYFGEILEGNFVEKYNLEEKHIPILKEEILLLKNIFKSNFPNIDLDNINISNIDDILLDIKDFFEDILIDLKLHRNDIYKFLSVFNRNNSLLLNILDINFEFDVYNIIESIQKCLLDILNKNFSKYSDLQVFETKGYGFDFNLTDKKYFFPVYKFFIKGKKVEGIYDVRDFDHIYKTNKGYYFLAKKGEKYILYNLIEKKINNEIHFIMEKVLESFPQFVIKEDEKLYILRSNNHLLFLSNDGLEEYEIICKKNELFNYNKFIKSIKKIKDIYKEDNHINDKVIYDNKLVFEISDNYNKDGEFFEIYEIDKTNKMLFIKKFKGFEI